MQRLRLAQKAGIPALLEAVPSFDWRAMAFTLDLRAQGEHAGKTVTAKTEGKPVKSVKLALDAYGYAGGRLVVPAPPADGTTCFALLLDGAPAAQADLAAARHVWEIKKLHVRRAQLRKRFGIDRPWDAMGDAPERVRRHRGMVAHVLAWLEAGPAKVDEMWWQDANAAVDLAKALDVGQGHWAPPGATPDKPHAIPWARSFRQAYYSQADGAPVVFGVRAPPAVEGRRTYPLLVVIHGGPQVAPSAELPFFEVRPSGRGVWGYRSISRYDALQVIEYMKRYYPIDPDRVYVTGFSVGASGAMQLAAFSPDIFAAALPMVAFGSDLPLVNLRNLPVAIHHGSHDWVSSVCNVRVQSERMKALGCPVVYKEYPGVGHWVPAPHEPLVRWMIE